MDRECLTLVDTFCSERCDSVVCAQTHDEHVSMSRVRVCCLTLATADTCHQHSVKLLHVCTICSSLACNVYVKHLLV